MTRTTTQSGGMRTARRHPLDRPAILEVGRIPYLLSIALAVTAVVAAGGSLFLPDLLGGAAVTKGNLRGTAVVVLGVAVPLLLAAMVVAARNSARGTVAWAGAVAYLIYQGVLFCFATPLNSLFLAYVAFLGAGLWAGIALLRQVDLWALQARVDERMPARLVGGALLAFVTLNALAWLARIVPTVGDPNPVAVMAGSGLLTSAVWVQDLAFWMPAAVLAGVGMWRRTGQGLLLCGALLTFYVVECVSVASDQWWGYAADPNWPDWASLSAVPMFLVLAAVTAIPLALYYRNIDR